MKKVMRSEENPDSGDGAADDDEREVIKQLKEAFLSSTERSRKVQILTALPRSWSVRKIQSEFCASNYMVRKAKELVREKGILS